MNFFNIKTTWINAEFIPLKLCVGYVIIGSYFHNFFKEHYAIIMFVFSFTVFWSLLLWTNKMKKVIEKELKNSDQ